MNRGDVCWYTFKAPDKQLPVLILTRESAIRSIPTELILTEQDGVPCTCAANFDNLQTVPKGNIGNRITRLTSRRMKEVAAAVSFALGLDEGEPSRARPALPPCRPEV
jgi:mRNA-degrading endonuclease toxin of MazEF toxin-antitoxin module